MNLYNSLTTYSFLKQNSEIRGDLWNSSGPSHIIYYVNSTVNHRIIRLRLLIIEGMQLKCPWVCSRSCSDFVSLESRRWRPRVMSVTVISKVPPRRRIGWLLIVIYYVHPSVSQLSALPGSVPPPASWSGYCLPPFSLWSHTPSLYSPQCTLSRQNYGM